MIITCPQCSTKYNLTAQQIGAKGRTMRCAKCSHSWFQAPVEETTAPIAPTTSSNKSSAKKPVKIPILIAIPILLLTLVGLTFWWLSSGDTPVPDSYNPINFTSKNNNQLTTKNGEATGLVLSEISRNVVKDGNLTLLLFTGKVTNVSNGMASIPEIRVQLLDSKGIEIDFWPAELSVKELKTGESIEWKVRFLNPPLEKIAKFKVFFRSR